jgi:IS5 family transposase
MRPKKHETAGSVICSRARLEQIINRKHELVQLADRIDWDWIDRGHAPSSAGGGMRVS